MVSGVLAGAAAAVVLVAGGVTGPVAVAADVGGPRVADRPVGGLVESADSGPELRPRPRPVLPDGAGTGTREGTGSAANGTTGASSAALLRPVPLARGGAGVPAGPAGAEDAGTVGTDGSYALRVLSRFSEPGKQDAQAGRWRAFTYDTSLVPSGAGVDVEQRTDGHGTTVTLRVAGLAAGHAFGAHVHTGTCAADPAAAGGHYQNRRDPRQPSKDAAYANDRNEVWLDLRTEDRGAGTAKARHTWNFRPGEARSVVLHGAPGGAGERVACFTVPFRGV
ncbi:superoxide dismutase [Streptomyces sp. NPDC007088]|uniref:superoxide dismutase n=1 Tax=Streptomyces sp. NPDC007088 TaxID=3364773 RepID=UPI00367C372D